MSETLLQFFTNQGPAVAILAIGGYYLVKYFMGQIDKKDTEYREEIAKKDERNQENLDRYIVLSERAIDVMGKASISWDLVHPKLNEMHEDIKKIRDK